MTTSTSRCRANKGTRSACRGSTPPPPEIKQADRANPRAHLRRRRRSPQRGASWPAQRTHARRARNLSGLTARPRGSAAPPAPVQVLPRSAHRSIPPRCSGRPAVHDDDLYRRPPGQPHQRRPRDRRVAIMVRPRPGVGSVDVCGLRGFPWRRRALWAASAVSAPGGRGGAWPARRVGFNGAGRRRWRRRRRGRSRSVSPGGACRGVRCRRGARSRRC